MLLVVEYIRILYENYIEYYVNTIWILYKYFIRCCELLQMTDRMTMLMEDSNWDLPPLPLRHSPSSTKLWENGPYMTEDIKQDISFHLRIPLAKPDAGWPFASQKLYTINNPPIALIGSWSQKTQCELVRMLLVIIKNNHSTIMLQHIVTWFVLDEQLLLNLSILIHCMLVMQPIAIDVFTVCLTYRLQNNILSLYTVYYKIRLVT